MVGGGWVGGEGGEGGGRGGGGGENMFPFFCKVCPLNNIYIFFSRQLKHKDMIRHVLKMRSKDLPQGSYESRTTTFSVM